MTLRGPAVGPVDPQFGQLLLLLFLTQVGAGRAELHHDLAAAPLSAPTGAGTEGWVLGVENKEKGASPPQHLALTPPKPSDMG